MRWGRRTAWKAGDRSAWLTIRTLQELDVAYEQGDYEQACKLIAKIAKLP